MADDWLPERLRRKRQIVQGEQQIGRSWLRAADQWTRGVVDAVMQPFRRAGLPPDPVMVLSREGLWVDSLNEEVRPGISTMLRNGWNMVRGASDPSDFNQRYANDYLDAAINRMVRTPDQVYRQVSAEVANGINAGDSTPEIAARVQQILTVTGNEDWNGRATVVARTETVGAVNAGSLAAAADLSIRTGQTYDKVWLATDDDRTRHTHREADGQRVPLTEPFAVGAAQLQYPGDQRGPAGEVIQCFPAGTRVHSPSRVDRAFRRIYEGEVITLRTVDGIELTSTPNHPLLTGTGWKAAQLIEVGDKLLGTDAGQWMPGADPHVQDMPTGIEEIHAALAQAGVASRVVGRVVDFHGDGSGAEVEVVPADGLLLHEGHSVRGEGPGDGPLMGVRGGPGPLPHPGRGLGAIQERGPGAETPGLTHGSVGGGSAGGAFLERGGGHPDTHGLAPATRRDASLAQAADDGWAPDPEGVRDCLDGLPGGVATHDVVSVERHAFHGDVYNLSTHDGWYIANGIAASNCRCTLLYPLAGESP